MIMKSLLLDDTNSPIVVDTDAGLKTLKTACGTAIYSQTVKMKVLTLKRNQEYEPTGLIDWIMFMENKSLIPVLGTQLSALIGNSAGVQSVDLSKATISTDNGLSISGICFTIDCEVCTLNI